jgi:hypothetical protein
MRTMSSSLRAARALDAQNFDLLAQKVVQLGLDRSIAAAMQHQLGLAAQKSARVDAQAEIGAEALPGVAIDDRLRVTFNPAALHLANPVAARAFSGRSLPRLDRGRTRLSVRGCDYAIESIFRKSGSRFSVRKCVHAIESIFRKSLPPA